MKIMISTKELTIVPVVYEYANYTSIAPLGATKIGWE
jgi:hypothetical protein